MPYFDAPHPSMHIQPLIRIKEEDLTLEMLEDALRIAAQFVQEYGDVYMCYVDRLTHEIEKMTEKQSNKSLIDRLAAGERLADIKKK